MKGLDEIDVGEFPEELEALLKVAARPAPAGFASRTTARFERALFARRIRRAALGTAALFLVGSAALWVVILDVFGVSRIVLDALSCVATLMASAMAVWRLVPITGVAFTLVMMIATVASIGALHKIGREDAVRNGRASRAEGLLR